MHKTRLANGLTVLLREMHTAPVVSFWVWYRVGSRNERTGRTGASHWVEHMLFKGTPRFPADALERSVSRTGGVWNAMTSMDWTTYYETMPSSDIDLALRLEADRMRNSSFKPADVDSERTVIISERQGAENSPMFLLGEELQAAAYCYASWKTDHLDGIDSFILHRHVDHKMEGGLNLGLWTRQTNSIATPLAKKKIYEVFKAADTPGRNQAFAFALPLIGITNWSQVLPGK